MYYKYNDQSNEDIHGLNSNKDYENMITGDHKWSQEEVACVCGP
jgi:hypothetical protein